MTDEHATALNSVLSVGGLRAELAAIVRYAGQCAEADEQARWAVFMSRAKRPLSAPGSRGVSGARRFLSTCCTH